MDKMQIYFKDGSVGMVSHDDGSFIRYVDIHRQVYIIPLSDVSSRYKSGKAYFIFSGNDESKIYDTNVTNRDIEVHQELVKL